MHRFTADEATVWTWHDYDRIAIKWRSQAHWDDIRVSLKEHFPRHCDLNYSGTRKLWSIPGWHRDELEDWLCWTFEPEAVHWDEQPAAGSSGRTYSHGGAGYGYGSYPHRRSASTVEAAYALLCLTADAPDGLIDAAYRWWSKELHPDLGGDGTHMASVNAAVDVIRAERQRRAS
jgi:hypothetical protein